MTEDGRRLRAVPDPPTPGEPPLVLTPRALIQDRFDQLTRGWSEDQKEAVRQRLKREASRLRTARRLGSAGALAASVDPTTVQTPALEAVDSALEYALSTRSARVLITMPPQEGKSTRVSVWGVLRALQLDPERRIVLASYAEQLAQEHSRTARNWITTAGSNARDPITGVALPDRLGLGLSADKSAAGHWQLQGHKGGMYVAGIQGGVTGRPAELLIVDDPIKDLEAADSQATREQVISWWLAVATTRLAPGAPVILVQTRWHEEDLAGYLLAKDKLNVAAGKPREWLHVNVPAVAEPGVTDVLERPAGEPMVSARGRTAADWAATRDAVGPRVWGALYQGTPTPVGGGLFSPDWWQRHRRAVAPPTQLRAVCVDPAETGKRDEAGVVAGGATLDGRVAIMADRSGRMTSDRWARAAVLLALELDAHAVLIEAYTTEQTYRRVVRDAWRTIRLQARLLRAAGGDVPRAAAALAAQPYPPADPAGELRQLEGLLVPDQDDPPFAIHPKKGKGDKIARATGTRQAAESGRLAIVGSLPGLELQATTWQLGKGSPDRVDAMVHLYEWLVGQLGQTSLIAAPQDAGAGGAPAAGMADLLGTSITVGSGP